MKVHIRWTRIPHVRMEIRADSKVRQECWKWPIRAKIDN